MIGTSENQKATRGAKTACKWSPTSTGRCQVRRDQAGNAFSQYITLFDDTECLYAQYERLVCEANVWKQSGTVAWHIHYSSFPYRVEVIAPFKGNLPSSVYKEVEIYGATVFSRVTECQFGDMLLFNNSYDRVILLRQKDCQVFLGGRETVENFNWVLQGMLLRAMYSQRTAIYFGYIYWTNIAVRSMSMDYATAHVYAAFHSQSMYTNSTPFWPGDSPYSAYLAPGVCASVGMYPVELTTAEEERSVGQVDDLRANVDWRETCNFNHLQVGPCRHNGQHSLQPTTGGPPANLATVMTGTLRLGRAAPTNSRMALGERWPLQHQA